MKCCEARAYLDAYADSELCTERALDVEAHLSDCKACRAELSFAKSVCHLTRSACGQPQISAEFEGRLRGTMRTETLNREHHRLAGLPLSWSAITPLAAAAAAAFWFNFSTHNRSAPGTDRAHSEADVMNAAPGLEQLVEAMVQNHSQAQKPRFTDTLSVSSLEPELGLPVHAPNLDRYGARFVGANMVNVRSLHAVSLHYSVGSHRVTLYVFDPEAMPLRTLRDLRPRVVGDRAVFVGQRRGYSIAACEDQGVGYAVAADLGDDESAELLAALDD